MTARRLKLISVPGTRATVIVLPEGMPAVTGGGDTTFVCGDEHCPGVLLKDIESLPTWLSNVVFKCGHCGGFNVG